MIASSCTKPVLIGSDFLENEKAFLVFQDTFDLSFHTEEVERILTHSDTTSKQLITYLLGHLEDPIFGRSTAQIFVQPLLPTVATELIGSTFDSVILQLKYDTLGIYGSLTEPVTIEVYRMTENPVFEDEYYTNQTFMTEPDILGSVTIIPRPFDSIHIDTNTTLPPHIRIPLSTIKFGHLLLQDSSVFSNQDTFLNYFNGLNIRMTGATNTMIGIDLLNVVSKLSVYYKKGTSTDLFDFVITAGSVKTVHMEHDYTGSFAEPYLSDDEELDYWFVQGMAGLTTSMKIEDLDKLDNVIINLAEIEVYCTFPDGDVPHLYHPVEYMVTQSKEDGDFINSLDVAVALARTNGDQTSTGYNTLYGGQIEKIEDGPPAVYRYNMKVTAQVKDIVAGKNENIIYFNPFDKANVPNRSVMIGPGHPKYAPRLRIYYTAL